MAAHAFLPPSGAADWSRCALWATMNDRYPQDDSPATLEGTAAHWVLAEMLEGHLHVVGEQTPNGQTVTDEMLDGAELAVDVIDRRVCRADLHVEERVEIDLRAAKSFGTPDVWHAANAHLEIFDYKFGHGFVDEVWNEQGLLYMLGILAAIRSLAIRTVSFTIIQPRCYHQGEPVRTHTYRVSDAAPHLERLEAAAELAIVEQPVATTGNQCSHCPGRHACPTLQRAAYSDAEFSSDRQPHDLSPQAAGLELRMLERAHERLGARVDGLRELTLANLKAGKAVPHYRVESGKGRKQWSVPTEEIVTLGEMMGKVLTKVTPITPNQAEKIIDPSVISAYSQIIPGSQKLVPENNADALKVFGRGE